MAKSVFKNIDKYDMKRDVRFLSALSLLLFSLLILCYVGLFEHAGSWSKMSFRYYKN